MPPGVVLLEFFASWCVQSETQRRELEQVVVRLGTAIHVCRLNVETGADAVERLGIESVPTVLLVKNGEESCRFVGLHSANTLVAAIQRLC